MLRAGIWLNILAVIIITAVSMIIDPGIIPVN